VNGGRGQIFGAPTGLPAGYAMEEFFLEGEARRYRAKPGAACGADGLWDTEPVETAPYKVRFYVARPDASAFNGILQVNWQNVTANMDLGAPSGDETFRGYAWAGVTTQKLGVDGLPGVTKGLTSWDAERYGTLHHPGDAFSYDIFAQAARVLCDGPSEGDPDPLAGLRPQMVLAVGASQSAMRLGSYINAAHQHDRLFDGFLLDVHWGNCPPLEEISLQACFAVGPDGLAAGLSKINDRGDTPIFVMATECEASANYPARQPQTETFRFWETAGAAHVEAAGRDEMMGIFLRDIGESPIAGYPAPNIVRRGFVRDGALRWLVKWVRDRTPPPQLPLIAMRSATGIDRDEIGNAIGGLRLPEIVAATGVHLGSNDGGQMQRLAGTSRLFTPEELLQVHGSRDRFLEKWDGAVDDLVEIGAMLPAEAIAQRARARALWADSPQPASA
jgi:hypothetical protein